VKYIRTKMVIFTQAGAIDISTPLAVVERNGYWEVAVGQFKGTPIQGYQCEALRNQQEYSDVKESLYKANRAIRQMEQIIQTGIRENQLLKDQLEKNHQKVEQTEEEWDHEQIRRWYKGALTRMDEGKDPDGFAKEAVEEVVLYLGGGDIIADLSEFIRHQLEKQQ
jgi:hypothetical protein